MKNMGIDIKQFDPKQFDPKQSEKKQIRSGRRNAEQQDKKLEKACQEFASIFYNEMIKSMRKGVPENGLFHGGQGEDIYRSLLDQEYAKKMASQNGNSLADALYQQFKGIGSTFEENNIKELRHIEEKDFSPVWPVISKSVSSDFGWRKDPINGEKRFHYGMDFPAEKGTLVRATMSGRVMRSEFQEGYGNMVEIDHGSGITTLYAHNEGNLVKEGDWIEKGTPLAKVGSTGRSTGPHLHFEVRNGGKQVDPREFLERYETV